MTNKKSTKKALLMSCLSLLLCMSMLVGTTFAWFTDSVSTTNNIITAGNLDVNLYWSTDGETWAPVDANTNIFKTETLWEPGHTEVVYLKVANEGTLALKYDLIVNVASETAGTNVAGEGFNLSDYILYKVTEGVTTFADSAAARRDETGDKLNVSYNKAAQKLLPGNEVELTMVVFMPTTVGNEANYLTGTNAPVINLGINLFATQQTKEEDSFGPDYDADAEPVVIYTAADLAAALTSDEETISVILGNNIDLPISSLGSQTPGSGEYKMGGANTKAIVINLNGNKLNVTTTYWSVLGTVNPETVVNIKNGSMTSSQATGTWNSYDLCFASGNFVFENVVFEKAVALETGATFKNVTINETHDYYALWITAEGQTVTIDGLSVNSTGRGIKIDEQYVDAPEKVTLNVANADFNTAKKAAIMVKSAAGADINLNNVDITDTVDPLHAVWVDEDAAAYYDLVTVTGGEKICEKDVNIATPSTIQDMINNAAAGEVILLGAGEYHDTIVMKSGITLQGTNGAVVDCINLNGADNVTLKGIDFDAAGAKMAIGGDGKNRFPANIIGRDSSNKSVAGARGVVIEGCTFSGEFVDGGMAICFSDQTKAQSGDITIKDCKFATTGGYVDIYTYYAGWGELIIEGNTFASVTLDYPIYLGRYQSGTPVVVKGNTFENKASFDAAAYIQDHSSYGVSFDAADNTFNG